MIIKKPLQFATVIDRQGDCGVFDTMEDAIRLACEASKEYSTLDVSKKNDILDAITKVFDDNLEELSLMASKETCTTCNNSYNDVHFKTSVVLNNYKNDNYFKPTLATDNKTEDSEETCIVNGVIVPECTPVETIIKNSVLSLKAGNAVVFSPNKNAKHVFAHAIKLINNAIEAVGGPKNLIVTIKEPSEENTNIMIENENIALFSTIVNNTANIAL